MKTTLAKSSTLFGVPSAATVDAIAASDPSRAP